MSQIYAWEASESFFFTPFPVKQLKNVSFCHWIYLSYFFFTGGRRKDSVTEWHFAGVREFKETDCPDWTQRRQQEATFFDPLKGSKFCLSRMILLKSTALGMNVIITHTLFEVYGGPVICFCRYTVQYTALYAGYVCLVVLLLIAIIDKANLGTGRKSPFCSGRVCVISLAL